jgi:hypothetical protein
MKARESVGVKSEAAAELFFVKEVGSNPSVTHTCIAQYTTARFEKCIGRIIWNIPLLLTAKFFTVSS